MPGRSPVVSSQKVGGYTEHVSGIDVNIMMLQVVLCVDWATQCPDICSSVILGVSVRLFWGKISILVYRLSKADCPTQWGWVWHPQLKT